MKHKNDVSQYDKMTKTPIPRLICTLSVPTVISMLVTNIYNLADTAFVGQLGNSASGATGIVFGFMAILQAFGFLFGQGAGSLLSRALGGRDTHKASVYASTGFFSSLVCGFFVMAVGFIRLDEIVMALGSTLTIAPYAKTYITFILIAAPFMTSSLTFNSILRYEGKAALGMAGLMTGAVLNMAGDPILMFGFGMNIAGAGLSTAISQMISWMILLFMFLSGKTETKISLRCVRFWRGTKKRQTESILPEGNMLAGKSALPEENDAPVESNFQDEIILPARNMQPEKSGRQGENKSEGGNIPLFDVVTTGFPSLLRQGLNSLATVVLNSQCKVYGDPAVAAMSIVSRIIFFAFSVAIGVGQGFQPVAAYNYGAGKFSRLRAGYRFTIIFSECVIAVGCVLLLVFSSDLIGLFRDDSEVIAIGTRALRLQALAQLVLPACMATEMLFQSTGRRLNAAVLSALRSGILFIPMLLILASFRGLAGIQEAQPAATLLAFPLTVPFALYFFRKLPADDGKSEGSNERRKQSDCKKL